MLVLGEGSAGVRGRECWYCGRGVLVLGEGSAGIRGRGVLVLGGGEC